MTRIGLILPNISGEQINPETSRLSLLFEEFKKEGVEAELVLYSDELVTEVENQISRLALVLVWINPIHEGRDRSVLDAMLIRVAKLGVVVSAHPLTILKMGTKDVLYHTRDMSWGCDIHIYDTYDKLTLHFLSHLALGPRVLKQFRGNGGDGIWRIEYSDNSSSVNPMVRILHAKRGSIEESMTYENFLVIMKAYFEGGSHLIDQEYQQRISDGMTRCYMSLNKVVGFGHQFVTALVLSPENKPLEPPPRYYYSKEKSDFQRLRKLLEEKWIQEMQEKLDLKTNELPLLWDADFLLGEMDQNGNDAYVLCEINVSSVYPYPEEANSDIVKSIKSIFGL